jgi:hypothetical protein
VGGKSKGRLGPEIRTGGATYLIAADARIPAQGRDGCFSLSHKPEAVSCGEIDRSASLENLKSALLVAM